MLMMIRPVKFRRLEVAMTWITVDIRRRQARQAEAPTAVIPVTRNRLKSVSEAQALPVSCVAGGSKEFKMWREKSFKLLKKREYRLAILYLALLFCDSSLLTNLDTSQTRY